MVGSPARRARPRHGVDGGSSALTVPVASLADRSARTPRGNAPAAGEHTAELAEPGRQAQARPRYIDRSGGSHAPHVVARILDPEAAWGAVQLGFAEILDVRTGIERRRYGAPPGARPVSLAKHMASPEGPGAIYLCQHAIRSKATLRRGAAEVAGGFAAWIKAGLPVEEID